MSVEVTMLVYATALLIALVLIQALAGIQANSLADRRDRGTICRRSRRSTDGPAAPSTITAKA